MNRTRYLCLMLLTVVCLGMAGTAIAAGVVCWYGVVEVSTISGTDPDGTIWIYTTYYMGWQCTDGYLDGERPYDPWNPPGGVGGPDPNPDPPQPDPVPGCSLSQCLADCDAHYLQHAGVEVIGNTEIQHILDVECGLLCMEFARADWNACRGHCTTDCSLA